MKKIIIVAAIAVVLLGGAGAWYVYAGKGTSVTFKTAKVERGNLVATISATGTIEPKDGGIDVGAQVNGPIVGFGYDPHDGPDPSGLLYSADAKKQRKLVDFGTVVHGGPFKLTERSLKDLEDVRVPDDVLKKLRTLEDKEFANKEQFLEALAGLAGTPKELAHWQQLILNVANNATVLAQIDPGTYQTAVDRMKAMVASAAGSVEAAQDSVEADHASVEAAKQRQVQLQALADQYEADWKRAQLTYSKGGISAADYDLAKSNYLQGKANVASAAASVAQTVATETSDKARLKIQEATLNAAVADLQNAVINLGYCTIRAPVEGTIIDRRVNIGQTIVSNQTASSLFLMARDLGELQVWASVNEADIGSIEIGQAVTFTVDAYPGRTFDGTVAQIRLNAAMTQNVVTYTVVISTKNINDEKHPNGMLLPYMTANLKFIVKKQTDVLLLPNSALRYKPNPDNVVADARDKYARKLRGNRGPGADQTSAPDKDKEELPTVWVMEGKYLRPKTVHARLTDGIVTEIDQADLEEGTTIVIGESRGNDSNGTKNPFTPNLFRGR